MFPPIEKALKSRRPIGLSLTTEEAYDFLRHSAPLLEEAGLGVLVPPWWSKRIARLGSRLKVSAQDKSQSLLGLGGLVDYLWELALRGETLTWEEFARLAALKTLLVKVRGQ